VSNIRAGEDYTVKQAAVYPKTEPEIRPYPEFNCPRTDGYSGGGEWSPRQRVVFLIGAALASWALVGLIGYGVYSLLG
jgi:hypothetical protein